VIVHTQEFVDAADVDPSEDEDHRCAGDTAVEIMTKESTTSIDNDC